MSKRKAEDSNTLAINAKRPCTRLTRVSTDIRHFQDGRLSSYTETLNGVNHGVQELHDEVSTGGVKTPTLLITMYEFGKKHGRQLRFVNNILRSKVDWDNDEIHGKVIKYYASGKIKEASLYLTGVLSRLISWNESGEFIQEQWFNDGVLKFTMLHIDNDCIQHTWYEDNEQILLVLNFDAANRIKSVSNYKDGLICNHSNYNIQSSDTVLETDNEQPNKI